MNNKTTLLPASGAALASAVPQYEFNRLLQMPRSRDLEGDLLDRAIGARQWYSNHGKPFVASRAISIDTIEDQAIRLTNNVELNSLRLADRLRAGEATGLVILA